MTDQSTQLLPELILPSLGLCHLATSWLSGSQISVALTCVLPMSSAAAHHSQDRPPFGEAAPSCSPEPVVGSHLQAAQSPDLPEPFCPHRPKILTFSPSWGTLWTTNKSLNTY